MVWRAVLKRLKRTPLCCPSPPLQPTPHSLYGVELCKLSASLFCAWQSRISYFFFGSLLPVYCYGFCLVFVLRHSVFQSTSEYEQFRIESSRTYWWRTTESRQNLSRKKIFKNLITIEVFNETLSYSTKTRWCRLQMNNRPFGWFE